MKKYLITDPLYYPRLSSGFCRRIVQAYIDHHPHFIALRDTANRNYRRSAVNFLRLKRRLNAKFILHNDWRLAVKLGADGVQLSAKNRREIHRAKRAKLLVIVSCHSVCEAELAVKQGADHALFSPIFFTPHKGAPKGTAVFNGLKTKILRKIIALGGVTDGGKIAELAQSGVTAFASIRYFLR